MSSAPANPNWTRTPRLLVVDDERVVADTTAMILRRHGYDAAALYTAEAALDSLSESPPDLLITDVVLNPDSITGIDLAVYLERHCPECKVVLITGNAAATSLHAEAKASGHALTLLQKPIKPEKLLDVVSTMLRHLQNDGAELKRA